MAFEAEGFLGVEVEDFDGLVDGAACEELGVEVHAHDAVGVALEGRDALARVPVPDFDGACGGLVGCGGVEGKGGGLTVEAAADQLGVVKLQRTDAAGVAAEGADLFARLDVPCRWSVSLFPRQILMGGTYKS